MRYLSVCSGIEAATVAWHDLGWTPAAFSEIEKFPSQVLAHHYPSVPNVGDMTKFKEWNLGTIDLLVGGTPCQSFSVAGLRKGLDDPRGNLMLTYLAIANKYRPKWLVWENVPGVLSSGGGGDFGVFLGALGKLGYGFAYRVLDAQYFGVAQRRRRVFVVGCLGDWRSAAAVLFERESLSGNPAPSREKGKEAAGTVTTRSGPSDLGGIGTDEACSGFVQPVAHCLETTCHDYSRADGFNMIVSPIALAENTIGRQPQNGGNGDGFTVGGPMYTLNASGVHGVAQPIPLDLRNAGRDPEKYDEVNRQGVGVGEAGDPSHTLTSACVHGVAQPTTYACAEVGPAMGASGPPYSRTVNERVETEALAIQNMAVRRLTPVECERLQGFPDNYTDIMPNGKPTPDGPRYKALGNSMAVPVMKWIGQRIQQVELT